MSMISPTVKYPISEIFTSWQGEGLWSGTSMTFIRLAGCSVGKHIDGDKINKPEVDLKSTKNYGVLPIWQEECTTFDGRKFLCDTDFRVKERLTAYEILERVPPEIRHICITGGEPLIHDLFPIIATWIKEQERRYSKTPAFPTVHIETSGTKLFNKYPYNTEIWLTVSPKYNCLAQMIQRADEVKFLVDKDFNEDLASTLATYDTDGDTIFWLSPINTLEHLSSENIIKCLEILERHRNWRMMQQNHKIWSVR